MYKNRWELFSIFCSNRVSILVLMELCIKTLYKIRGMFPEAKSFNPCFNGTMYKNIIL